MEIIIEIFFERLIIRLFGVFTRFLFFLLLGRKRSLIGLRGKDKGLMEEHSQDFWNAIVGLISLIIVIIGLSYLLS